MRMMAISDIHAHLEDLEKRWKPCDACVIVGDIGLNRGGGAKGLPEKVEWWNTEFKMWCELHHDIPILVTPGNAEIFLDQEIVSMKGWSVPQHVEADNVTLLVEGEGKWHGLKVYAYPWVGMDRPSGGFTRRGRDLSGKRKLIPTGLDLLLAHSIDHLEEQIAKVSPKLVFCGHEHPHGHPERTLGLSRVINVAVGDQKQVYNDPFVIEL